MNYQHIIVVGNATGNALTKKGDVTYTVFSLGVSDAKDRTTYFPVIAFGDRGKAVAKYIKKGRQILVDGRLEVSEKTPRFKIIANRLQLGVQGGAAR